MAFNSGLTMRNYREDDFWRIRAFLRRVFLSNGRCEDSWLVARFDYWRWHGVENLEHILLPESVFLWETAAGEIAAVLNPEGMGEAFFQVDPAFRSIELERALLAAAEQRLAVGLADGRHSLRVWANASDALRRDLLLERGYAKKGDAEHLRRRPIDGPIPAAPLPSGYTVRSLGDGVELIERCYASGLAFHNGDIRIAAENRDVTWYRNIQNAPLYRRDLDIVAVAPDGAVAAFTTIWFDDTDRSSMFEPVATVPDHRRRGLARAVIYEGLRRLQRMGADLAFVGGYSERANALYAATGFERYDLSEPWVKEW